MEVIGATSSVTESKIPMAAQMNYIDDYLFVFSSSESIYLKSSLK